MRGSRPRDDFTPLHLGRGPVYTMEQALERMRGLLGTAIDWVDLAAWLPRRLDRRAGAAALGDRGELRRGAGAGEGRAAGTAPGGAVPADLPAPRTGGMRMNETTHGYFAEGALAVPPPGEQERMVEAVLFASRAPLSVRELAERLPQGADVEAALAGLRGRYEGRGVELRPGRRRLGVPHGGRPRLPDEPRGDRDAQAVARGHRDAGDRRLPPAGHAGGDRGDPRRVGVGAARSTCCWSSAGSSSGGASWRRGGR